MFLGDNVYGDVESEDLRELRDAYAMQAAADGLSRLREAAVPLAATWDDHDYGLNDGGAEFFGREEAQRIFEDFWGVPADSERAARPGGLRRGDLRSAGPPSAVDPARYALLPLRASAHRRARCSG